MLVPRIRPGDRCGSQLEGVGDAIARCIWSTHELDAKSIDQSLHGWKPDGAAPSTWACSSNISKPLILPPLTAFSPSVAVLEWRLGKFSEGRISEAELPQLISATTWSREARA